MSPRDFPVSAVLRLDGAEQGMAAGAGGRVTYPVPLPADPRGV